MKKKNRERILEKLRVLREVTQRAYEYGTTLINIKCCVEDGVEYGICACMYRGQAGFLASGTDWTVDEIIQMVIDSNGRMIAYEFDNNDRASELASICNGKLPSNFNMLPTEAVLVSIATELAKEEITDDVLREIDKMLDDETMDVLLNEFELLYFTRSDLEIYITSQL